MRLKITEKQAVSALQKCVWNKVCYLILAISQCVQILKYHSVHHKNIFTLLQGEGLLFALPS